MIRFAFRKGVLATLLSMDWSNNHEALVQTMSGDSWAVGEESTDLKAILEVKSTRQSRHLLNILCQTLG